MLTWITNLWRWISRLWKRSPDPVFAIIPEIKMMTVSAPPPPALISFEPTRPFSPYPPRKHHSLISYQRRLDRRRLARIEAARAAKAKTP